VLALACQNVTSFNNNLNAIPAVTADTKLTDLRASLTTARGSLDSVANAAKSLNIAEVNTVVAAYDSLSGVLNAITGETIGADNVTKVNQGLDSFRQASGGLNTALKCP
jgi:3-keto-L-gulonate-6-phosphate decarboxylase